MTPFLSPSGSSALIVTVEDDFGWFDEEEDERVDNMLELINSGV